MNFDLDDLEFEDVQTQDEEEEKEEKTEELDNGKSKEETEKDEQTETSSESESSEKDSEEEEVNPLVVITEHLHEKGIIDKPEDFDGSDDAFEKLISAKIDKGIEEYKGSLNELSKSFLDYLEAGGSPETFIQIYAEKDYSSLKDSDIAEVDDADEDEARNSLRKEIIRQSLKMQGWEEGKIEAKIKKYEDTGILADEAVDNLQIVRKVSLAKKQQVVENQKTEAANRQKAVEKWMTETTNIIDNELEKILGVEIPKRTKDEFKDFLMKRNPKTGKTPLMEKRESDPHFDVKAAFAAYGGFEDVKKSAKSKANTSLADKLKSGSKGLNIQPKPGKVNTDLWKQAAED